MKIWVVFRSNDHSDQIGNDLVIIFSSEEKAEAFCEEHEKSRKFPWESRVWYEDWKVE